MRPESLGNKELGRESRRAHRPQEEGPRGRGHLGERGPETWRTDRGLDPARPAGEGRLRAGCAWGLRPATLEDSSVSWDARGRPCEEGGSVLLGFSMRSETLTPLFCWCSLLFKALAFLVSECVFQFESFRTKASADGDSAVNPCSSPPAELSKRREVLGHGASSHTRPSRQDSDWRQGGESEGAQEHRPLCLNGSSRHPARRLHLAPPTPPDQCR